MLKALRFAAEVILGMFTTTKVYHLTGYIGTGKGFRKVLFAVQADNRDQAERTARAFGYKHIMHVATVRKHEQHSI